MAQRILFWGGLSTSRMRIAFERLMWVLSIYLVPAAIGVVSIAALLYWDDQYAVDGGRTVQFQIYAGAGSAALRHRCGSVSRRPLPGAARR